MKNHKNFSWISKIMTALALMLAALSFQAFAEQAPPKIPTEARVLWVVRYSYKNPEDVKKIISNAKEYGFNIILWQGRGNGTVFYESDIEPWAYELTSRNPEDTGTDPGWNPLEVAIEEAHKAGLELHLWMNLFQGWNGLTPPPEDVDQLWNSHRDWFMWRKGNFEARLEDGYVSLSPCNPEVRDYLVNLHMEAVEKYAIDGIHFDYFRFTGLDIPYDPPSLAEFRKYYGGSPDALPDYWQQFRRECINDVARRIYEGATAIKPDIKLSAAVVRDPYRAYSKYGQDTFGVMREKIMDFVCPMVYEDDLGSFIADSTKFTDNLASLHVYPGIATDNLVEQIEWCRENGVPGFTYFPYTGLFRNHEPRERALALKKSLPSVFAKIPDMPWRTGKADINGPYFQRIITTPYHAGLGMRFFIEAEIKDNKSGVYDDDTGPEGQGVYVRWDSRPDFATARYTMMDRIRDTDIFRTVEGIPAITGPGGVIYYEIFAHDNFKEGRNVNSSGRYHKVLDAGPGFYQPAGYLTEDVTEPTYCEIDKSGRAWVYDSAARGIKVFDISGNSAPFSPIKLTYQATADRNRDTRIDLEAEKAGRTEEVEKTETRSVFIYGLAMDYKGVIYATGNARNEEHRGIYKFNSDTGEKLEMIPLSFRPYDLAVDDAGHIFVMEYERSRIHILNAKGEELEGSPLWDNGVHVAMGIAVTPDGRNIYVASQDSGAVLKWSGRIIAGRVNFEYKGIFTSSTAGGPDALSAVSVDRSDHVYVADQMGNAVHIFDTDGNKLTTLSGGDPGLVAPWGIGVNPSGTLLYISASDKNGAIMKWVRRPAE